MAAHLVILNEVVAWWAAYAQTMYEESSDGDRDGGGLPQSMEEESQCGVEPGSTNPPDTSEPSGTALPSEDVDMRFEDLFHLKALSPKRKGTRNERVDDGDD